MSGYADGSNTATAPWNARDAACRVCLDQTFVPGWIECEKCLRGYVEPITIEDEED